MRRALIGAERYIIVSTGQCRGKLDVFLKKEINGAHPDPCWGKTRE